MPDEDPVALPGSPTTAAFPKEMNGKVNVGFGKWMSITARRGDTGEAGLASVAGRPGAGASAMGVPTTLRADPAARGIGYLVFANLPNRWTIADAAIIISASGLYTAHG